ncbi:MAG: hypothetical protein ABH986_02895 [archaeon]
MAESKPNEQEINALKEKILKEKKEQKQAEPKKAEQKNQAETKKPEEKKAEQKKPELKIPEPKQAEKAKPVSKPSMSSNSIILIVIVFALLVSLVFVLTGLGDKLLKPEAKEKTFTCPDGTVVSSEDQCPDVVPPKKKLSFDERYDLCLNESSVQIKDECIQELAIEFNKQELCVELVNLDEEKCVRAVLRANAVFSADTEECNSLITKFDRVECIKEIALLSLDKTVCDKLSDSTERNSCLTELAIEAEDLSVCDSIKTSAIQTCKFNTAIAIADVSSCSIFSLPKIRYDCISRIAEKTNNVSLCEQILDSSAKSNCLSKFP